MGEYHNGRKTAIHAVGSKVEHRLVEQEKEIVRFTHKIEAFDAAGERLKSLIIQLRREITSGKVPVKMGAEAERWLKKAAGDIYSLHVETSESKQKAEGAHLALKETVESLKKMFDEEERKKSEIEEWESRDNKTLEDFKERPIGAEIEPGALVMAREHRTQIAIQEEAKVAAARENTSQLELVYDERKNDEGTPEKPARRRRKPKADVQENLEPKPRRTRRRKKGQGEQAQVEPPAASLDT